MLRRIKNVLNAIRILLSILSRTELDSALSLAALINERREQNLQTFPGKRAEGIKDVEIWDVTVWSDVGFRSSLMSSFQ